MLFVNRQAISDGARGQVFVQPRLAPVVRHAMMQPIGLGDKKAALLINAKRDDVRDVRLGGKQINRQPFGNLNALDCIQSLLRRLVHLVLIGVHRNVIRVNERVIQQNTEQP